jgi:hypothetical protein
MELQETYEVCTEARANHPWWKWWAPALTLHSPQVLGVYGKFVPDPMTPAPQAAAILAGLSRPTYGYSRRQCRQIQKAIDAASRSDAGFA